MADPFTWTDLLRWLTSLGRRALPNRVLRLAWWREKLLASIELFHFNQAPHFYLNPDRGNPELLGIGFNVFNFTPFKIVIVGVQLRLSIDSRDFLIHEQRFPAEASVPPHGRGGFFIRPILNEAQAARVRAYPTEWARVRVDGVMIVRTPYGELRKESMAVVVALIDRGAHNLLPHTSTPG